MSINHQSIYWKQKDHTAAYIVVEYYNINPLPHGDANRHTIFKRKN